MSRSGKKRYVLSIGKLVGGITFIALTTWGTISLVSTIENNPREVAQPPVKELVLNTDGVLNREWVVRALALPKNATLLELDLPRLQDKLMESGQVRTVMFAKQFPATLNITVTERTPVARIMGQDAAGQREFLVARDGVVFHGEGYDSAMTGSLPWLDGVKLSVKAGRIQPLKGMEQVSNLLTKARFESEHLYATFRTVNLSRLDSDNEIEVVSPECEGVVFSTKEDYFRQLALLDYIRDSLAPTPESPLARLDLTNAREGIVPVSFKNAALNLAGSSASTKGAVAKAGTKAQPAAAGARTPSGAPQARLQASVTQASYRTQQPAQQQGVRSAPTRPQNAPASSNLPRKSPQREL
jgi:cell division protein FtsQ